MANRLSTRPKQMLRDQIKKVESQIETLGLSPAHLKESARNAAKNAAKSAAETAETAVQSARAGLDQVLLELQHKGLNLKELKDPQDLIHNVALRVLEQAESVREQLASNRLAPSWLKEFTMLQTEIPSMKRTATKPVTMTAKSAAAKSPKAKKSAKKKSKAESSLHA